MNNGVLCVGNIHKFMSKTTELILPDFGKKEEIVKEDKRKGPRPPKVIEKEVLPRSNRNVECAFCGTSKTLNPDQYQKRFDYFGSDDGVEQNFQCQDCETSENNNPFRFWFSHNPIVNNMALRLRPIFETYTIDRNALKLQDETSVVLNECGIRPPNYTFLIENGLPAGLTINFPFIGNVLIKPKEYRLVEKIAIV